MTYQASDEYRKLFDQFEADLQEGKFDSLKMRGSHWADEKQEVWIEFIDLNHPNQHKTIGVYRGHKLPYRLDGFEYEIGSPFGYSSIRYVPRHPKHQGMEESGTQRIQSLYNMRQLDSKSPEVLETLRLANAESKRIAAEIDTSREGT